MKSTNNPTRYFVELLRGRDGDGNPGPDVILGPVISAVLSTGETAPGLTYTDTREQTRYIGGTDSGWPELPAGHFRIGLYAYEQLQIVAIGPDGEHARDEDLTHAFLNVALDDAWNRPVRWLQYHAPTGRVRLRVAGQCGPVDDNSGLVRLVLDKYQQKMYAPTTAPIGNGADQPAGNPSPGNSASGAVLQAMARAELDEYRLSTRPVDGNARPLGYKAISATFGISPDQQAGLERLRALDRPMLVNYAGYVGESGPDNTQAGQNVPNNTPAGNEAWRAILGGLVDAQRQILLSEGYSVEREETSDALRTHAIAGHTPAGIPFVLRLSTRSFPRNISYRELPVK